MKMKRIVLIVIFLFLLFCTACAKYSKNSANIDDVRIKNMTSTVYSKEDMKKSLNAVLSAIKKIKGIYVYSISYAGDKKSNDELIIRQKPPYNERILKCFYYNVSFKTSIWADSAWGKLQKYDIDWIIAESSSGEFYTIDSGIGQDVETQRE